MRIQAVSSRDSRGSERQIRNLAFTDTENKLKDSVTAVGRRSVWD